MDNDKYFEYDKPKKEEIQKFIEYLEKIAQQVGILDFDTIYYEFEKFGIKESDFEYYEDSQNLADIYLKCFQEWFNNFYVVKKIKNINIELSNNYFCYFSNKLKFLPDGEKLIKLYIPMDKEHIKRGAIELFEYIAQLDVLHDSKIAREIRSDNVVVRLSAKDYDAAQKIIDFVNNNEYIKSGLNSVNPFVPTINGIGMIYEYGRSYNADISTLLCNYINSLTKNNRYDGNIDEFYEYVKQNVTNLIKNDFDSCYGNVEDNVKETLNMLNGVINGKAKVEDTIVNTITSGSITKEPFSDNDINKGEITQEQINIFLAAISETYKKYGCQQVNSALKKCLHGDYNSITRGSSEVNLREKLRLNLPPSEIYKLINRLSEKMETGIHVANEHLDLTQLIEKLYSKVGSFSIEEILANEFSIDLEENAKIEQNPNEKKIDSPSEVEKTNENSIVEDANGPISNEESNSTKYLNKEPLTIFSNNDINKGEITQEQINIFLAAISETYKKYGCQHVNSALNKCLWGDYNSITRGSSEVNLREKLRLNLTPSEIYKLINRLSEKMETGIIFVNGHLDFTQLIEKLYSKVGSFSIEEILANEFSIDLEENAKIEQNPNEKKIDRPIEVEKTNLSIDDVNNTTLDEVESVDVPIVSVDVDVNDLGEKIIATTEKILEDHDKKEDDNSMTKENVESKENSVEIEDEKENNADDTIKKVSDELDNERSKNAALTLEKEDLNNALDETNKVVSDRDREIEELKKVLAARNSEIASQKLQIESLNSAIFNKDVEINNLTVENKNYKTAVRTLLSAKANEIYIDSDEEIRKIR